MDIATPIVAAVIGSIVAGVISFVINKWSLRKQEQMNEQNRQRMNEMQWRRDTISSINQLRREALRMDLTDDIQEEIINDLIDEIEVQTHRIPESYSGTLLKQGLEDILLTHHEFNQDDITDVDYRTQLIDRTEAVLDRFEELPKTPDNLY